jgi:hypothetical protein
MAAQAHTSRPGNGPRPLTQQKQRSIDGRQNRRFCAARPGPENHAEQAFPHRQEEFEPAPLSARRRNPPAAAPESCRAEGHRGSTESGDPAAGARPAPVRPNLMSGRPLRGENRKLTNRWSRMTYLRGNPHRAGSNGREPVKDTPGGPRRDRPSGGRSVPYAASAWRGGQPALGVA